MKRVILISGEICSGKDTFVRNHFSNKVTFDDIYVHIDLGSLVRKHFKTSERIFDNNLEPYFMEQIDQIVTENGEDKVYVITGLRQVTLCKKIENYFDKFTHYYLAVPRSILRERFENRADTKDKNTTFDEALKGDQSLGLKELQYYLLTEVQCTFVENY